MVILVITRDRLVGKVLTQALSRGECRAVRSSSVKHALEELRRGEVDAVVADATLHGPDDFARLACAANWVRPATPIIAISGDSAVAEDAADSCPGPAVHLAKPFRIAELVDVIAGLLSSERRQYG